MKNGLTDILNSLFSSPDKALLPKGSGSVSAKGSQPSGNTFEDVLAQLATQENESSMPAALDAPASPSVVEVLPPSTAPVTSTSGSFFESLSTISEIDIKISEKVTVGSLDQLAQAEKALVSLAAGLSKLINLFSNIQSMDVSQAQAALVSFSGGKLSGEDAGSLLNSLREMASKIQGPQNPLLLTQDQQNVFLNQMLQQMVQNQQILFGAFTNVSGFNSSSSGGPSSSVLQNTEVYLQMSFSETQISQFQQNNNQSSQVFIDIETFQMSATFIQTGTVNMPSQGTGLKSNQSFQPVPVSDSLVSALNQMFSSQLSLNTNWINPATPSVPINASSAQDDLNKTFKNLVQMLVQSGASQAVLTAFLNQQKDQTNSDLKQGLVQMGSADNLMKNLAPGVEIAPVLPNDSVSLAPNNAGNTNTAFAGQLFVEQIFTQTSLMEVQNLPDAGFNNPAPPPLEVQNPLVLNNESQSLPNDGLYSVPAVKPQAIDESVIKALNDVVARLNNFSDLSPTSQTVFSGPSKTTLPLDQLLSMLNGSNPVLSPGPSIENPPLSIPVSNPLGANALNADQQPSIQTIDSLSIVSSSTLVQASAVFVDTSEETAGIQASINELISISQFTQTQTVVNSRLSASAPLLVEPQQNNPSVTTVAQTQLFQTVLYAGQGSAPNENTAPGQSILSQNSPGNQPSLNISEVRVLPSELFEIPTLGNSSLAANSNPPLVNLSPLGPQPLLNPEQGIAKTTHLNPPVNVTSAPASPVAVTIQETVTPHSIDVQVNISQTIQDLPQVNNSVPAATTPGTTVSVSTAQNVSASIVSGEVIKVEIQTPTATQNNLDSNHQMVSNTPANISGVQPVTSQAVIPVSSGLEVSVNLNSSNDLIKNTKNPENLLVNNSLLNNPVVLAVNKANDITPGSNQGGNKPSAPKVDSFLILNQVQDQIRVHASEARAVSRLDFQLIPESLGRVTVQIALVDQAVSARIIVSHQDVKEALQTHMIELKTALNQAGLQIDQLQVQVQGGQSNLLAQYYQYQQEGFGYSGGSFVPETPDALKTVENTGVSEVLSARMSLLDVLA